MTPTRSASLDRDLLCAALKDQLARVERLMLLLGWEQDTIIGCTIADWALLNRIEMGMTEKEKV